MAGTRTLKIMNTQRLRKYQILRGRQVFGAMMLGAKKIESAHLMCFYAYMPEAYFSVLQVAFAVGKKYIKKAVARNKIKRRMREIFRRNRNHYLMPQQCNAPYALFFYYRSGHCIDFNLLETEMQTLLSRLQPLLLAHQNN